MTVFKVTVEELLQNEPENRIKRFEQTVDELNLKKLIAAVNDKPRGPRAKKPDEKK